MGDTTQLTTLYRYFSLQIHLDYIALSGHFEKIAIELDSVLSTVESRGRSFHEAILSLNDSIMESYLDLLGNEGSTAAQQYAHELHNGLGSTAALQAEAKKVQRLAKTMGDHQVRIDTQIPRNFLLQIKDNRARDALLRLMGIFTDSWHKMNKYLMEGGVELEKYIQKVADKLPERDIEVSRLKRAVDLDIIKSRMRISSILYDSS